MSLSIAVVQPISFAPPDDHQNLSLARDYIEKASRDGAAFIAFPESFPGPWRMPAHFDPIPQMMEFAAQFNIHIIFGTVEPIDRAAHTAYNLVVMAYPDGNTIAKYRRTHPNGPWIYTGGKAWEFQYTAGNEFPVFDTVHGKVGLMMCSEVFMPEISRGLALRGAEIIFMPAGVNKRKLWSAWRNLTWSRAIENLAIVVTSQNMFSQDDLGLAMVAGPEDIYFESSTPCYSIVEIDLERILTLRAGRDSLTSSLTCGAKEGILSEPWQRPELYDHFYPRS